MPVEICQLISLQTHSYNKVHSPSLLTINPPKKKYVYTF